MVKDFTCMVSIYHTIQSGFRSFIDSQPRAIALYKPSIVLPRLPTSSRANVASAAIVHLLRIQVKGVFNQNSDI